MSDTTRTRSGALPKIAAVAWREFRHTVLTKGFLIGAIAFPLMMFVAVAAVAFLMGDKVRPVEGTVVILDPSGTVQPMAKEEFSATKLEGAAAKDVEEAVAKAPAVPGVNGAQIAAAAAAAAPKVRITVEGVADMAQEDTLRKRVAAGDLLALVIVPPEVLLANPVDAKGGRAGFSLIVPSNSPPRTTTMVERASSEAIVRARVASAGKDYTSLQTLLSRPGTDVRRMSKEGAESQESVAAKMLVPAGFMMLLWIATFTSGNYLLTSTIEEKSSKVMEVLLSAVSPMQLLLGKILGYSLVSAVMLVSYGGLAMAGLTVAAATDLVPLHLLVYLAIYFVMAYLFVATIMVSVGSAVSDLREAQSLVGPAMMVLIIPLMLWMPISDNPNGWLATAFSFLPPAIPYVMILRVTATAEPIPFWQVLLSIVWGYAWVFVFLWSGSKIFRVGVLMQGKPPTPRELLRWIRMA